MDIASHPFFQGLEARHVHDLLGDCCEVEIAAGDCFIREGERGGAMFIIAEGTSEVFTRENGRDYQLAVIEAPAVLGEIEGLTGGARAANVRASTQIRARVLEWKRFLGRLDQGDPAAQQLLLHLARVLARRLAAMNKKFAELHQREAAPRRDELREFQRKLFSEWSA